jgi:LCP family protein required for cell wall assembly
MIEEQLRAAFARHEPLVPDASRLAATIETAARRRRARRWVLRGSAVAVAIALVAAIPSVGRAMLRPVPLDTLLPVEKPVPDWNGRALNFLIAGLDVPLTNTKDPARSDTVILAHVPADRSAVYLVTIPRNLHVSLPPQPNTSFDMKNAQLNWAYQFGGFPLLAKTVENLVGVTLDGAATVDLAGVVTIVDTLGGVDLCVDIKTTSIHTGHVFQPGCRRYSGAEMKDYLRQRRLPDGALDRDRHGAQFLAAVVKRAFANDTLTDPAKLVSLATTARDHVVLDLGGRELTDLMAVLRQPLGNIIVLATPVHFSKEYLNLIEVDNDAGSLFEAVRSDRLGAWAMLHPGVVITA